MHEVEHISEPAPLPEYICLPDLQPMSPDLPLPEPIVPEMPIIDVNLSNSLAPVVVHCQSSNSTESDSLKESSTTASKVSRCSPGCVRASGPHSIYTLIIPHRCGRRGHGL